MARGARFRLSKPGHTLVGADSSKIQFSLERRVGGFVAEDKISV
jgi:hypothetical protein